MTQPKSSMSLLEHIKAHLKPSEDTVVDRNLYTQPRCTYPNCTEFRPMFCSYCNDHWSLEQEAKNSAFTLAITGARIFSDYTKFETQLLEYLKQYHEAKLPDSMVAGGALGADTSARKFAEERHIKFLELKPQYHLFKHNPRGAPLARNKDIIDAATHVVAFPMGYSSGTRHAIKYAKEKNKPIVIYEQELGNVPLIPSKK